MIATATMRDARRPTQRQTAGTTDGRTDIGVDVIAAPTDDMRYAAIMARDRRADGVFWYAVRTTGVFCRPSCGARPPRRENVSFYASTADAVTAGYRACRRCRPDHEPDTMHAEVVTAVCRQLEAAVAADHALPTLDALAHRTGYSSFHLHRLFKRATGLTPRAFGAAARARKMREMLDGRRTVTQAIHAAGYASSSRFYEDATTRLGMQPSRANAGGAGEMVRYAVTRCSLGPILVAATARGVCAIAFDDDPHVLVHGLHQRFPHAEVTRDDGEFTATVAHVVAFVEAPARELNLPLDIRGTAFQERVWNALQQIPAGQIATYADVALAIGKPSAARAVASACAANELAVAIPCHRVVRAGGALSGYRWGVERKREMLAREGAVAAAARVGAALDRKP